MGTQDLIKVLKARGNTEEGARALAEKRETPSLGLEALRVTLPCTAGSMLCMVYVHPAHKATLTPPLTATLRLCYDPNPQGGCSCGHRGSKAATPMIISGGPRTVY